MFCSWILGTLLISPSAVSVRPTFYQICKKKTAEGYHSIPYMVALSSAMMLLYYGILKTNAVLIISINVIGCAIEIVYLVLYIIYAPKREKVTFVTCKSWWNPKQNLFWYWKDSFVSELAGFNNEVHTAVQHGRLWLDHLTHQFINRRVQTCDCHGMDLCCLQCCRICFSFKHHGL